VCSSDLLSFGFGALIVLSFALIFLGGVLHDWLLSLIGGDSFLIPIFAIFRWIVILAALTQAFALAYRFAPAVHTPFRIISPGSGLAVLLFVLATFGFKIYVEHFSSYDATYGGLGAVIVLMLWLYLTAFVILLGAEIDSLLATGQGKSGEVTSSAP
jgi:membrane protein